MLAELISAWGGDGMVAQFCAWGRGVPQTERSSKHPLKLYGSTARALSLAVFCWTGFGVSGAFAEAMLLPGSFDVDGRGAAAYSIPITVPPGTAGMVPALTLDYSSQSGNGLEGVGWSLTGLPSIGRCPQTVAQDGFRSYVTYDIYFQYGAADRYCLDGQRLIVINGGTYGADGSEYRTELEGFSKILAHGATGTGPIWFEVHTKSGQIMEFGHSADSQLVIPMSDPAFSFTGITTLVRGWAVNKISDTKGNYLTVTYQNDAANGQSHPTRIDYTGNDAAGLSAYNSVRFSYAVRPDIVPQYQANDIFQTTVRLSDISVYSGATLVRDYKLGYGMSPSTGLLPVSWTSS